MIIGPKDFTSFISNSLTSSPLTSMGTQTSRATPLLPCLKENPLLGTMQGFSLISKQFLDQAGLGPLS